MRVVCDIETDALHNPQNIWVICCKDIDTGEMHVFTPDNLHDFVEFSRRVSLWVGHNFLWFDLGHLVRLVPGCRISPLEVKDTLVISKLLWYNIPNGHSLDAWGVRVRYPKNLFNDFSCYSKELQDRCIGDCELTYILYKKFLPYIDNPGWKEPLQIEHYLSIIALDMNTNGFRFNLLKAKEIYSSLVQQLDILDTEIKDAFPPKPVFKREITPRATKFGTLHKGDFRFLGDDPVLDGYIPGASFSTFDWREFNPGSVKQIVERLEGYWSPVEKTKGGESWKVNETNLETVSQDAPRATQKLVQRFLVAQRVRVLDEWFRALRGSPGQERVHGTINHIGTWTHRCSHTNPNMGNVPSLSSKYQSQELKDIAYDIGVKLRSLWICDDDKILVGCDADGIQLRVLAHYINDYAFTTALISGNKEDGTDAHSLNARALGEGISRDQAKTFIYAFLLGVGVAKTAKILGCSLGEAEECRARFIAAYPGLAYLREELIPRDVARGYFDGFDGRKVMIDQDKREGNVLGFVLGGYLQNGEACIMKHANVLWRKELKKDGIFFRQTNFIHDEWQTECYPGDAERVGTTQADSIRHIGYHFDLNCPMAGNFRIGRNWYETH